MITRNMTPEQRKQYCESVIQDWKDSGMNGHGYLRGQEAS